MKGRGSGQQLPPNHSQCPLIAGWFQRFSFPLFRRHVGFRPGSAHSLLTEFRHAGPHLSGHAEVNPMQFLRRRVIDDVLRLDVLMEQLIAMSIIQRFGHWLQQLNDSPDRQALSLRVFLTDQSLQRDAVQKLHHLKTAQRRLFADIIQRTDVLMMQGLNSSVGSFEIVCRIGIESQPIGQKIAARQSRRCRQPFDGDHQPSKPAPGRRAPASRRVENGRPAVPDAAPPAADSPISRACLRTFGNHRSSCWREEGSALLPRNAVHIDGLYRLCSRW